MFTNINHFKRSNFFIVILFIFISCSNKQNNNGNVNENGLLTFRDLISANLFSSTFDVNDSNLFVFIKTQDEYRTSYMYIINKQDSFINVEYRLLPSFKQTGYSSYHSDTSNFLFYECYKIKLSKTLLNEVIAKSQIINQDIVDTFYIMNQGFSMPNYLLWYDNKLLVGHVDSKYINEFRLLDSLLYEFIGKQIEFRRDNPITKFKEDTPLPKSKH